MSQIQNLYRRNRHWSCVDGFLHSVMVGTGESYFVAFALFLNVHALGAALLATVPLVIGALVQLLSPAAVRHLGSHRTWVVSLAYLQALSFLPLAYFAWRKQGEYGWLLVITTAYFTFGFAGGSAWNFWMKYLVPPEVSHRYFAFRSQVIQLGVLSGMLISGLFLNWPISGLAPFVPLFLAAFLARFVGAYCLSRHSYQREWLQEEQFVPWRELKTQLKSSPGVQQLPFILLFYFAMYMASPYYTPLMLGPLQLSHSKFMILLTIAVLSKLIVYPWLGKLVQARGLASLFALGSIGIAIQPTLWTFSQSFWYLLQLQVLQGVCLAAFEYAVFLTLFNGVEQRMKTQFLSLYNLATAIVMVAGSLLGGKILSFWGESLQVYYALFWLSTAARVICLLKLKPFLARSWSKADEPKLDSEALEKPTGT